MQEEEANQPNTVAGSQNQVICLFGQVAIPVMQRATHQ